MEDILESLRRIIYRWVRTSVPLTADVATGGTTLSVSTTHRFRAGDEIALFDPYTRLGEPGLRIAEVVDNTTLRLESGIRATDGFSTAADAMVVKTYNGNFIQAIYLGDPAVIPQFPAIAIMPGTRSSEWLTLGITTETYNVKIVIYTQSDNQEDSYRFLMRIANAIQEGLKKNIYPLIGPYTTSSVVADVSIGDDFIRVADTREFFAEQKIVIENSFRAEELEICAIIDGETLQVKVPPANPYLVLEDSKVIGLTRFVYNSWPSNIDYGTIHKGSLLHAATIDWFAKETEQQVRGGWSDPQLS